MAYYIGIDGGGSKTLLRMTGEDDAVVFEQAGGGSNPYTGSPEQAERVVRELVTAARTAAGSQSIAACCMGAAGADTPEDFAFFDRLLRGLLPETAVRVVNDGFASLYATLPPGKPGVVITAGTGSICWGRDANGDCCRVGGWGNLFSDEGSGYAMVADAMRIVCCTIDGRTDIGQELFRRFLAATGTGSGEELVGMMYTLPTTKETAAYFPLVSQAAEDGDAAALTVLKAGAAALRQLCADTAARMGLPAGYTVGYNGGVLTRCGIMRRLFEEEMRAYDPTCPLIEGKRDIVWGNLQIAKTVIEK